MMEGRLYIFAPHPVLVGTKHATYELTEEGLKKMEPVDLSKATAGTIAHFRCGGSAPIHHTNIADKFQSCSMFSIYFVKDMGDSDDFTLYYTDGRVDECQEHPFDIIRLEQPAFDWDTVKPGMAFVAIDGGEFGPEDDTGGVEIVYYVGEDFAQPDEFIAAGTKACTTFGGYKKRIVMRLPPHDITPERKD